MSIAGVSSSCLHPSFKVSSQMEELLNTWISEPTVGEGRSIAKDRILECYRSQGTALDLSELGLTTLPDIFSFSGFEELLTVNFSQNKLSRLPSSIFSLRNLYEIIANDNELRDISEEIGNLSETLEVVNLSYNNLETLPNAFEALVNLSRLHLSNNDLKRCSFSFSAFNKLSTLTITDNTDEFIEKVKRELQSIPKEFCD